MKPAADIAAKLTRRPLWKAQSAAAFMDVEYDQIIQKIQNGELLWAFNVGTSSRRVEPRILSHCIVECKLGQTAIGPTNKLNLAQVINLILPQRDLRSTELRRILSCSHQQVFSIAKKFKFTITRKPNQKDGPNSYTVFSRASVARFLMKGRMS